MSLMKKTTASLALVALTSGFLVNGTSAYSQAEVAAAELLASKGIVVKQTNAADYQLDRQVLRQEIAAVSRGLANLEKTTTCSNVFKDVSATKPNTWACYTVEALAAANLIAKNENFRPESNITKAEAVGMVVKARYGNEYNPVAGNGSWEKQVVDFAVSKGIVSNFTNYTTAATRGFVFEVAAKTYNDSASADDLLNQLLNGDTTPTTPTNNVVRNDSNLNVALSPESPANGMVVANSDRAQLLAFTVTAGKEDVTLNRANLKFTGLGNYKIVENLEIYSNDVKVTRNTDATFNSRLESNLSFDRAIVVKAGETRTMVITAKINPGDNTYNQTVRVDLVGLESSATVTGANLVGATLTPYSVSNRGAATITTSDASGRLNIGEENNIYNFSVRETSKREDIVVKAVTFTEGDDNGVNLDNLSNLVLTANGDKVNATFTYQKSKVVASTDYTVKSGETVNFALRGTVSDDLNKKLVIKLDNVYSTGASTRISTNNTFSGLVATTTTKEITGTAVNFTFNREGGNEVSADAVDVKVGDLTFVTTSNYSANLTVKVEGNSAYYENLEVDGNAGSKNSDGTFTFRDVVLNKGTTKLPLTVDVKAGAVDSSKLKFTVTVSALEDGALGDKITNISRVLNNTQLSKEVTVRTSSFKLSAVKANDTRVVPKGNQQVVLYKGTIDLAGSEKITLQNLTLNATTSNTATTLDEYISGVTLNVGGKTFNGDVNASNVNFSSVYATIEGGAKGVQVLVTATLKDKELTDVKSLQLVPATVGVSAENARNVTPTLDTTVSTTVNLVNNTVLETASVSTNNLKDDVLAGTANSELAAIRVKDTSANVYFNNFKVKATSLNGTGSLSSALKNIRLMDGTTQVAAGGYVEGTDTVRFDNFTLNQSGNDRTLKVVADINPISTAGGEAASFIGKLAFTTVEFSTSDATGILSANGEEVSVVPAMVTYTASKQFTTNGNNEAVVKVTVAAGNNQLSSLDLSSINFGRNIDIASLKVNNDSVTFEGNNTQTITLTKDVKGLNTFDVTILLGGTTSEGAVLLKDINVVAKESNSSAGMNVKSSTTDVSLGSYAQ